MKVRQLVLLALLTQLMWAGLFVYISGSSSSSSPLSSSERTKVVTQRRKRTSPSCGTPPTNCIASAEKDYDTSLLLLIVTDMSRAAERQAARDTWLTKASTADKKRITIKFVIGVQDRNDRSHERVAHEVAAHGDIAFVAGFRAKAHGHNLNLVLRWASQHYRFRYLMKVDDTSFVMIEKLLKTLESIDGSAAESLVWGRVDYDGRKSRESKGRAYNWMFKDYSVSVLSSVGYVLSQRVVNAIVGDEDATLRRSYTFENMSLSIWLSVFQLDYLSFKMYTPSSGQPICPEDKSDIVLYNYANPTDAFKKLNFCLYLEESWFKEDHSKAVSMFKKNNVIRPKTVGS